jgi:hypothetical protein
MSAVLVERDMEMKASKLESDIEHMKSNTTVIAAGVRRLSDRVEAVQDSLSGKIEREAGSLRAMNESLGGKIDREIGSLRTSGESKLDSVRTSLESKIDALTREIWSTKVWTLLIAAAILGVMAHGFKWL